MDHYQDIQILPDPEFQTPMLMNALFAKLHRALVQLGSTVIGVSFPKMDNQKPTLGRLLRLHGTKEALRILGEQRWLNGMRDHIEVDEVMPVPTDAQHCRVKRVQAKSSAERLRRRYCKRHQGTTERDAIAVIPDGVEEHLSLPYLHIKSESTGQSFRLFIEHQAPQPQATKGEFNSYGLSTQATVPWF